MCPTIDHLPKYSPSKNQKISNVFQPRHAQCLPANLTLTTPKHRSPIQPNYKQAESHNHHPHLSRYSPTPNLHTPTTPLIQNHMRRHSLLPQRNLHATVSPAEGYVVTWPSALTSAVSSARMVPYLPPTTRAEVVLLGRVMCARPVRKKTHL